MWSMFCTYFLILLCFINGWSSGSVVTFQQQPTQILPPITKTLVLRCSIADSSPTSSSLVGKRSVTNTAIHIKYLTSLTVFRNGQQIASVSTFASAAASLDIDKLKVTGDVSRTSGDRGYLNLTWKYPQEPQSGNYTCEASGISDNGHNVVHSATAQVDMADVSLTDIMDFLHKLDLRANALEVQNVTSTSDIATMKSDIASLKSDVAALKTEVAVLQKDQNRQFYVRLVGGEGVGDRPKRYGTPEVSYHGFQGPICDDHWDINDAHVVCRMLGWDGAISSKESNYYKYSHQQSSGTYDFILDEVDCKGTETSLDECGLLDVFVNDCSTDEVAGVECRNVRLP